MTGVALKILHNGTGTYSVKRDAHSHTQRLLPSEDGVSAPTSMQVIVGAA